MTRKRLLIGTILLLLVIGLVGIGGLWLWVLASSEPLTARPAAWLPWPIVCSTRGCVTTSSWAAQQRISEAFATTTQTSLPTPVESLTTVTRRHLVQNAFLQSPVTRADARRYREEILNLKNEDKLREAVDVSLEEYDQQVIVPFLQQEALRQQYKVETVDELYTQLSQQRKIFALLFDFKWNTNGGRIEAR